MVTAKSSECTSPAQGRIGDHLSDEFSDQLGLGWAFEVTRGEKGGEFSVAIEEEAFLCFDNFGDGGPAKKRRTVCAREFDAVCGEDVGGRFGAYGLPVLVDRVQLLPNAKRRYRNEQSYTACRGACVHRHAHLECYEAEERAQEDRRWKEINREFDPARVESGVAEVEGTHVCCDGMRLVVRFGQHGIAPRRCVSLRRSYFGSK